MPKRRQVKIHIDIDRYLCWEALCRSSKVLGELERAAVQFVTKGILALPLGGRKALGKGKRSRESVALRKKGSLQLLFKRRS